MRTEILFSDQGLKSASFIKNILRGLSFILYAFLFDSIYLSWQIGKGRSIYFESLFYVIIFLGIKLIFIAINWNEDAIQEVSSRRQIQIISIFSHCLLIGVIISTYFFEVMSNIFQIHFCLYLYVVLCFICDIVAYVKVLNFKYHSDHKVIDAIIQISVGLVFLAICFRYFIKSLNELTTFSLKTADFITIIILCGIYLTVLFVFSKSVLEESKSRFAVKLSTVIFSFRHIFFWTSDLIRLITASLLSLGLTNSLYGSNPYIDLFLALLTSIIIIGIIFTIIVFFDSLLSKKSFTETLKKYKFFSPRQSD